MTDTSPTMNPAITQPVGNRMTSPGNGSAIDIHVTVADARISTSSMSVADAVPRTVMMPPSQRVTGPSVIGSVVGGAHVLLG